MPTYNEAGNIEELLIVLQVLWKGTCLPAGRFGVVVDDNSPDGTGQEEKSAKLFS
jgi:hypothetical protein